jgi:hypothetical protein
VTELGKTRPGDKTHVSGPDHSYAHRQTPL